MNLINYKKKFRKISFFIYIDCNIYDPVKNILNLLGKKVSKEALLHLMKRNMNLIKVKKRQC